MDILTVILCIIFGLCLYLIIKDCFEKSKISYKTAKNYPGNFIYPILGNIPQLASLSPEATFRYARTSASTFKESYREWMFGNIVLNFIRPKDVELILSSSKHFNKSNIYQFLHSFLGTGLLTSSGKKWQQRRRILTPAFHFNILQQFFGIFKEETKLLIKILETETKNQNGTNMLPLMSLVTLNTICETAMGVKLEAMVEPDAYRQKIYEIGMSLLYRLMRPWLHSDFMFKLSGNKAMLDATLNPVHDFTKNIIDQRRVLFHSKRHEFPDMLNENVYVSTKRRFAMLDTLLAAEENNEIDNDGIREEVDTFTFEGHDTTSAGLTFSFLLIALHQAIQSRVFEEICEIIGNRNIENLEAIDFHNMKYLDRVIKECLRMYPPVPFISRELSEDLMTDKGLVPKGSAVHIHIFDLHRDPDQFPDPEIFDPDRFLPECVGKRHPYSYIPFSAGLRNCIGQKFAMLELKTIISSVLFKYKLKPITKPNDIVFIGDLVLRSKTPIMIKFESR